MFHIGTLLEKLQNPFVSLLVGAVLHVLLSHQKFWIPEFYLDVIQLLYVLYAFGRMVAHLALRLFGSIICVNIANFIARLKLLRCSGLEIGSFLGLTTAEDNGIVGDSFNFPILSTCHKSDISELVLNLPWFLIIIFVFERTLHSDERSGILWRLDRAMNGRLSRIYHRVAM